MLNRVISSNVAFVTGETLIRDVVVLMTERNISSVLVKNEAEEIIGIITERDIVQKFTLLDVSDKLTRMSNVIMSRPVVFVRLDDIPNGVIDLHLRMKIRHFPVLSAAEPIVANVAGILSITDIARSFLAARGHDSNPALAPLAAADLGHAPRQLLILAKPASAGFFSSLFTRLGYNTQILAEPSVQLGAERQQPRPLLFDMDGFETQELRNLIKMTKQYRGALILATSNPQIVQLFKRHLDPTHQDIFMKPIDISYVDWLITHKWHYPMLEKGAKTPPRAS
jgi:CBS domain-containing protein